MGGGTTEWVCDGRRGSVLNRLDGKGGGTHAQRAAGDAGGNECAASLYAVVARVEPAPPPPSPRLLPRMPRRRVALPSPLCLSPIHTLTYCSDTQATSCRRIHWAPYSQYPDNPDTPGGPFWLAFPGCGKDRHRSGRPDQVGFAAVVDLGERRQTPASSDDPRPPALRRIPPAC